MTIGSLPPTMKAVAFVEPHKVEVVERPTPKLEQETDIILKTITAGLCGSDLHFYRGHLPLKAGATVGHEVVGQVIQAGAQVKKFKIGDKVVVPFSTNCGKDTCFYCSRGQTSRCPEGLVFGVGQGLEGCQAEYVRVPQADGFVFPHPNVPSTTALLLADILPTGYFVAAGGKRLMLESEGAPRSGDLIADVEGKKAGVAVVVGCGPVGLCAISSAVRMFEKVFATDLAPARLAQAAEHGATALPLEELRTALLAATDGRGADVALEVVGHAEPLQTAIDLVRPFGVVSSCGVHSENFTTHAYHLYKKNLRFQFGQCSVPTYFQGAVGVIEDNQALFAKFIQHKISLEQAPEYYTQFAANKIGKTAFVFGDETA